MGPDTLREYDGILFGVHSDETRSRIRAATSAAGLQVDFGGSYLEFAYQGRDANRFVVRFLVELAGILGDAEGEIRCTVDSGSDDPEFEFYRIEGGKLLRQPGRIVRGDAEIVTQERL